ncbi:TTC3 ligase, partial [Panurus biarmicus]|nr:TTC3 ligase [Panurus biarmicus]
QVSQNELDWFHQDSEAQMKKWQQEKKENRENLKALRGTAKKHSDTNERYLKTIDDKEKQYNVCLNTFLDTREELLGQHHCCHRKNGNVGVLTVNPQYSSSSASAAPVLKSQIDSWEIFISNVKKQLEKVEAEYEAKMELVKKGARNCLSKVEIGDFPCP